MRTLVTVLFFAFLSANVSAIEPVNDQQVMFYYHIPLGADKQHSKHQFGLRFDNMNHDPRDVIQISTLESRPAAMDFRMGYDGVQSIKIHGVDYAAYLIARAAEDEDSPVEPVTEPQAAEAMSAEETAPAETQAAQEVMAEETASAETTDAPEEKGQVQKTLDDLPFGVVIGVILGIGLIVGTAAGG
jgi:hypothetical protein